MGSKNKRVIKTDLAPAALGPYSVAIQAGHFVYTSGQLGIDPKTGAIVDGGIEAETRQALTNVKNILEAAGSSLDLVVKTTVFLRDMGDFAKMNAVYAEFLGTDSPARSAVQVTLPKTVRLKLKRLRLFGWMIRVSNNLCQPKRSYLSMMKSVSWTRNVCTLNAKGSEYSA
jgi:2-iminobutanoate/2-iminopropanoate deaminase